MEISDDGENDGSDSAIPGEERLHQSYDVGALGKGSPYGQEAP